MGTVWRTNVDNVQVKLDQITVIRENLSIGCAKTGLGLDSSGFDDVTKCYEIDAAQFLDRRHVLIGGDAAAADNTCFDGAHTDNSFLLFAWLERAGCKFHPNTVRTSSTITSIGMR